MNAPQSRTLLGLVLCGGLSSRMGQDKRYLQRPDGRSQLRFAIDLLAVHVARIALSVGFESSELEPIAESLEADNARSIEILADPERHQGPAAGLFAGLRHANEHRLDALFCIPIDAPNLSREDLTKLIEIGDREPDQVIVASDSQGRLQPLVSLWPVGCEPAVRDCLYSEDRSLYRLIQRLDHQTVTLSEESLYNTNTPETWRAWHDRQSKREPPIS